MKTWPLQSECMDFYGDPRNDGWYTANVVKVPCPWLLRIGDVTEDHVHVHYRVAESLMRIFGKTWIDCGRDERRVHALHFDIYDGCYNFRAKRGSSSLSMHAFACALDFDAAHNPFNSKKFFFTRNMPLVANFLAEGWVWGGDWSSPDAMHFQAARVR